MLPTTPTHETYSELQLVYDTFNEHLFDGKLPACLLTLQREKRTFGYFSPKRFGRLDGKTTDEIALNPAYFASVPLVELMATIGHEMVHLWQAHFGSPGRGRYHNEAWAQKMEAIGLMPSHNGQPGGKRTGDSMADYPIAGGRFLKVCEQLLTQDFKISWYDRFMVSAVSVGDHSAAQGLPAAALAVAATSAGFPVTTPTSEDGSPAAAVLPANRSNRSKYTCECDTNVWGKPGLSINCNSCQSLFAEQTGDQSVTGQRMALPGPPIASRGPRSLLNG